MLGKFRSQVKHWWKAAPVATGILLLAVLATLFFATRSVVFWINQPALAEREQPVAAWMTPRYIARSWQVPRDVILDALQLDGPPADGPVSLEKIAELRGVPVDQVIADLEAAISAFRAGKEGAGR